MPARSLITTFFLLWISLSLASASEEAVKDTHGHPIEAGQDYYIVSAIWGAGGGGVYPQQTGNPSLCEFSIVQSSLDVVKGVPVKFKVVGTVTDKIYSGSTDLEIEFLIRPICAESSKWAVVDDPASSSLRVVVGGPNEYPNSQLVSGYFQIENYHSVFYKLVFCRDTDTDTDTAPRTCYDIGLNYDDGERYLVANKKDSGNVPFMAFFMKAEDVKGKFSII